VKDIVEKFIRDNALLKSGVPVMAALSGGADSVALALVLGELGYPLTALHCNFLLRGEESYRDESFVRDFCGKHNIPLNVKRFRTKEFARKSGLGIEMAARELRYQWFEEERQAHDAQATAVAHHKDDQAETLLLNTVRGAGLRGVAGMYPKRDKIVRPFLCVSRDSILQYLREKGQDFVTDSTNLERETFRNVIRLDIIPQLEKANPKAVNNMAETCSIVQDSIQVYRKGIECLFGECGVSESLFPLAALYGHPLARTMLYEWLYGKSFTSAQLGEMLVRSSVSGKVWRSSTHRVLKDRDALVLEDAKYADNDNEVSIDAEIVDRIEETALHIAYLDADLVTHPLSIRRTRQGDFFVPFGMNGKKLISDFLTDLKFSVFEKEKQKVLLSGEDIVWVVGLRSDNRYRVTDKTKRILKLTLVLGKDTNRT